MDTAMVDVGMRFWSQYQIMLIESVFVAIVAAHGCMALLKFGVRKLNEWDAKDPTLKK